MAHIVRLRIERRDGPDSFKKMLNAWKKEQKPIKKEYERRQSHETKSQKKRRKRRQAWIKLQKEKKLQLYIEGQGGKHDLAEPFWQ